MPRGPTSVKLNVLSDTELQVSFQPPAVMSKPSVSSYRIEYSTTSDFITERKSVSLTDSILVGPFLKRLTMLKTGVQYYVRVSACNSFGCGLPTTSSPSSLKPCRTSSAPRNVQLAVTSDTMLTVSFDSPLDNGGDDISKYRIEWDVSSNFNSINSLPVKGFQDIDTSEGSSTMYYTITSLSASKSYYVRVAAINSAGLSSAALSFPIKATPSLQVPGKPHSIRAVTGSVTGQIIVSWKPPRVPFHGIPCGGSRGSPSECPISTNTGLPASDGGSSITKYEVQYNEFEDFTGLDSNRFTTSSTSFVLNGLITGRKYYLRVLARNAQGSGSYCRFTDPNCLIVTTPVSAYAK